MSYPTPVQPGEPIGPRLRSAAWYNSTLPSVKKDVKHNRLREQLFLNKIRGFCADGVKDRFEPIGWTTLKNFLAEDLIPVLSIAGIDKYNWVVLQEACAANSAPLVITEGLTKANVTKIYNADKYVTYNATNSRLETSSWGKARLVAYNPDGPSIIEIGIPQQYQGLAKVTTGIPAGSATAPGSGTGVIVRLDDSNNYVEVSGDETILNSQPVTTATGIIQIKELENKLFVDVASCPS